VVKVKFMAKPGEQFSIRRRTYVAIEEALMEAGIHLAYPTVRVVSEDEPGEVAAAAARAIAAPAAAG
jgi:small-conductance mechanosensitive channel